MKKVLSSILISVMALSIVSCNGSRNENAHASTNDTTIEVSPSAEEESETSEEYPLIDEEVERQEDNKYNSISEIELDALQQLYLDINSSWSYSDALDYVISTGLPYSDEKYNGSRTIQVAFTEGCTVQKYKKESGDYIIIDYVYPKGENNSNDELDKYLFGTCCYCPIDSDLELIEHKNGYYFSYYEPGNYISKLGAKLELDSSMTKEEQMLYYFNEGLDD